MSNIKERFSASRLTIARERRGITQAALAEAIGVTRDAISKMESSSIVSPTQENVHKMALTLGFPIGWFYLPDVEHFSSEDLTFRSRRKMTAGVRNTAVRATDLVAVTVSPALRARFKFPTYDIPDLSSHTPEEAAKLLRTAWGLGQAPIYSVIHLLEKHGVETYWINEPSEHLDAWSVRRDDLAFVMLNTFKPAGEREQFDAAHELGHLVLHKSIDIIEDSDEPVGRKIETEANQFASAFLYPREQFKLEVPRTPTLYSFLPLKQRWRGSIASMIMRSREIGAINDQTFQSLFRQLSAKGWRKKEPGQLERTDSKLHRLAFEKLAQKGISPSEFAKSIYLPLSDLHELVPVTKSLEPVAPQPIPGKQFGHLTLVD